MIISGSADAGLQWKRASGGGEIQNGQLEEKRGPRKFNARAKACAEIRRLKRHGPHKGKGALKSRPHQLRVQLVERPKGCLVPKRQQPMRAVANMIHGGQVPPQTGSEMC